MQSAMMSVDDGENLAKARTIMVSMYDDFREQVAGIWRDEFETDSQKRIEIEALKRAYAREKYERLAGLNFVLEIPIELNYNAELASFVYRIPPLFSYFPSQRYVVYPLSEEFRREVSYSFYLHLGWGYEGDDSSDAEEVVARALSRAFAKRGVSIGDFDLSEVFVRGGSNDELELVFKISPGEARDFKIEYDNRLSVKVNLAPYTLGHYSQDSSKNEYLIATPEGVSIVDKANGDLLLNLNYDTILLFEKYDIEDAVIPSLYLFPGEKIPSGKGTPWIPIGTASVPGMKIFRS